jgi:2-polyprenyl-3-methyl-5-hydroxy-6-metoxy-1,4-benzoquinol methylase/3-polyprenyl-4-hydroxybenzoate decarboxylase
LLELGVITRRAVRPQRVKSGRHTPESARHRAKRVATLYSRSPSRRLTAYAGLGSKNSVTEKRFVRAGSPGVLRGPARVYIFSARSAEVCALEGDHAALVESVLDEAASPRTRDELVGAILESAGADTSQRGAVDQAIELLVRMGTLVDAPSSSSPEVEPGHLFGAHVLVCVTGAIGAVHAPSLVERLVAAGYEVRVAMTRSARRFVSARALAAITHQGVATSLWRGKAGTPAPHIELSRWADVVAVYPTTATTLARFSAGDCSEIVSAIVTATRAPVVLAPSMNVEMMLAPAVAENLERLRGRGMFIAHPASGIEVADSPAERVKRVSGAALPHQVARYVSWALERAEIGASPRLLSRAEWEGEHERLAVRDREDPDLLAVLETVATLRARVLDVGTGLGEVARAAAKKGFVVVATDFSRRAIDRARAIDPDAPVTWIVDDATRSAIVGDFHVVIDRACLGCVPVAARGRYLASLAALCRPSGLLVLKTHAPSARQMRAHTFTREEVLEITSPWFESIETRETTMSFGDIREGPAVLFVLRRREP